MKSIAVLFLFPFLFSGTSGWLTDFSQAKSLSREKHQPILLNFSGSDWCSGCIRLHKEIFSSPAFQQYAEDHLVLINADFPRLKRNSLPSELQKKNEALAERYNPEGLFPLTVLLDSNGTVIRKWEGYYPKGADNFIKELRETNGGNSN